MNIQVESDHVNRAIHQQIPSQLDLIEETFNKLKLEHEKMVNLIKSKNAEIQTLITLIKKVIPQYSTKQDALKPDVELVPDSDVEPLPDSNTGQIRILC